MEEGAVLLEALELARDGLRERHGEEGGPSPETAARTAPDDAKDQDAERSLAPGGAQSNRADALVALAETALVGGIEQVRGAERHQLVVHVDLEELAPRGDSAPAEVEPASVAVLEKIGALPAGAAERLACEASIVTLIERSGEPLSVGRKTRAVPPAIARALQARDPGCRFPGCERTRFIDAHHIHHWARGGESSLDNLVRLCRHHHRLIHEGRFELERNGNGELVFRGSSGPLAEVPALPKLAKPDPPWSSAGGHRTLGEEEGWRSSGEVPSGGAEAISVATAPGERFDLDLTVSLLARMAERHGLVPPLE